VRRVDAAAKRAARRGSHDDSGAGMIAGTSGTDGSAEREHRVTEIQPTEPTKDVDAAAGAGRLGRIWRERVRPLVVLVIVLTSFRSAVADWNDVPTGSMKPSIVEGDRIFVNKLAYGLKVPFTTWHLARWDTPRRGEVVVFNSPRDGVRLVKRVVGLPGDVIELRDGRLLINGDPTEYRPTDASFLQALSDVERRQHTLKTEMLGEHPHPVMHQGRWNDRSYDPVRVPEGHYFMLGDNRDNSADSREIGFVPLDQIVGRSSRVAMSFDYERWFAPRWERFFKPLP
jgi:signal peptidase I